MILPQNYWQCLIVLITGIVCWASWANLFKGSQRRYELFYVDVAAGALLAAAVFAFTLGNSGFDGLSVIDDLGHAGRRHWLFAVGGGALLNLGTMLMFAALSVAGMAVAYPLGIGLGLALGIFLPQVLSGTGNRNLLLAGMGCAAVAMVLAAAAHASWLGERFAATPQDPKKRTPRPSSAKALLLSVAGGMVMAASFPVLESSRSGESGMGPYSLGLLMALGAFGCTLVASLFLMNLPVEGEPVEIIEYFQGKLKNHVAGLIAGVIWATGTVGAFVVNAATVESHISLPNGFSYYLAAPVLAGLFGVQIWKEFEGSGSKGKILLALVLFAAAAALSVAGATMQGQ